MAVQLSLADAPRPPVAVKSFFVALLPHLCRSIPVNLPLEQRAELARHLAYANWLHALILAPAVAVLNVLFGLLPEAQYYRTGYWPLDRLHLTLTGLHVFMTVTSLLAFGVLLRLRPAEPRQAGSWHQWIAMTYVIVMVAAVAAFSVVEQRLVGSISAYLLGVAVCTTLFYTTPRLSFWVCLGSFATVVGGSVLMPIATSAVWHQVFIALHATVVFWLGSRLVYSLKVSNFLRFLTIEEQARQLHDTNIELARANQFKSDLLARAAHDLRDPLNSISLGAQTLREELSRSSALYSIVTGIDDCARRLGEFVRNLLTNAESDTHQLRLERTPTDLPRLVAEVVGQFRALADAKSISLHFAVDDPGLQGPAALVDRVHLRQVVENLLTNAIKFSAPRTSVWIQVTHAAAEGYRITVRDEGPGLTADDRLRLFGKYQRLSARPTAGELSTGLGLFIVHQLVELHGGRVWAECDGVGQGSRFIVTLP